VLIGNPAPVAPVTTTAVRPITGSALADLVSCERRVHNDMHADPAGRDQVNGFVELLWRNGSRHEGRIIAGLGDGIVDLREVPLDGRMAATLHAMSSGAHVIVGARFELGDRVGMPDLVLLEGGVHYAGDIKSGAPFAANNVDPKKPYAAQIGFYARLLADLGLGSGERAFVIGDDGVLVWFHLEAPISRGGPTIATFVERLTAMARGIHDGTMIATPAASAICGMCVWKSICRDELAACDDPTLVAGLGRAARSALSPVAATVAALAALPLVDAPKVKGVGPERLATFVERARLLVTPGAGAYATRALRLARRHRELHLDLETDPTDGNLVYLHGIHERVGIGPSAEERYVHFLAEDHAGERDAFAAAWGYLTADRSALITTYSAFERTTYRVLQRRYPEVATEAEVEELFAERAVDLYFDAVFPATVWPTGSMGLKSVARHLGVEWRDKAPSGAGSIGWFVAWRETGDPDLLTRILTYNCDDCIASSVVLDGLIALPVRGPLPWPPEPG
jgi:predicted RecB family nuclease